MVDFLTDKHVLLDIGSRTREEAFWTVAQAAEADGVATSARALYEELERREAEISTGLVDGFAIPHAKTDAATCVALYYARSTRPLAWTTLDGGAVTHMLFLIVPERDRNDTHLRMLSALAACLMEEDFKRELACAATPHEVVEVMGRHIAAIEV